MFVLGFVQIVTPGRYCGDKVRFLFVHSGNSARFFRWIQATMMRGRGSRVGEITPTCLLRCA
jgi:hypothetical protein